MELFFDYLLKSALWLLAFAGVYFVFLRNERYFVLNRIFLLTGLAGSLLFPLITFSYTVTVPQSTGGVSIGQIEQSAVLTQEGSVATVSALLLIVLLTGVATVFVRLAVQSLKVIRIIRTSKTERMYSAKVIQTDIFTSPFTFFSFVFVNRSTAAAEIKEIIAHEKGHIAQHHWFDIVLCECLKTVQWFNPLAWIYGQFVRQNHEYLADRSALEQTENISAYRAALLNQLLGGKAVLLGHSVNYSLNKKRFDMMTKMKDSHVPFVRRLKVLLIIPVAGIIFFTCAQPVQKEGDGKIIDQLMTDGDNALAAADSQKVKSTGNDSVFVICEEMPEFEGGIKGLQDYLGNAVEYPAEAEEKGIEGRVYVQFTINSEGKVVDATVLKGVHPLLDAEGLRAVNAMPNWKPGKQDGKTVNVRYAVPISFMLTKK